MSSPTDMLRMQGEQVKKRKTKTLKAGARALEACGDGFWEFDLLDGSAWFSSWFYRKLGWPAEQKRTTLSDLQAALEPATWDRLTRALRDHLEKGMALDVEVVARIAGDGREEWRLQGAAQRNDAGQPVHVAGSMRELLKDRSLAGAYVRLRGAFDALPVAAALLNEHAVVLEANRLWREFPPGTTAQAIARLKAANSHTAMEFWLDQGPDFEAGARRLRVRAISFAHEGSLHLAVTLEDRRSD